jgi:ACS family glucarate transporter-like MFS transporter
MNRTSSPVAALETPSRVRYGVLGFACALSMVTYLDRVCFAYAGEPLVQALKLRAVADLGLAFSAFAFAYAVFEIPSGWFGDVYGPRRVLIRIVLSWSVFTAITGFAGLPMGVFTIGFWGLVLTRFLFGAGEAGAYPNITRALHNWFPFHERGKAQGTVWMSGRLMGGLTPIIWFILVEGISRTSLASSGEQIVTYILPPLMTWRATFWTFGGLGIAWCVLFGMWFRDRPEQKSSVNAAELKLIRSGLKEVEAEHLGVPWLQLLRNTNLWALCLMYFCASYGWYFNITFLPSFFREQLHVDDKNFVGAIYKGGPLLLGAPACLAGGLLTDWFIRRTGNLKWGRRLFGVLGHGLCAMCYFSSLAAPSAFTFFLAVSLAAFCNDITMGAAWATCQDIGGRYAATVAGCMNTIGNLGGSLAGLATGTILNLSLDHHVRVHHLVQDELNATDKAAGQVLGYQIGIITFAAAYVIAALLWLRVDATKPVLHARAAIAPE